LLPVGRREKQPVSGKKKKWLDVAEKIGLRRIWRLSPNLWRITKQRHSFLHKKDNSKATREERLFWEVLFVIVQSVRQMPSRGVGVLCDQYPVQ
jgi:hypothetical protein